jgi:hypothetical protein
VGSAAAASSGFTVFVGILESVVLGLLSPLLKILFALSLLSPFSFSTLTAEIEKRIRASFVWILSVICFFLCASLAFESGLASSADSVAMRAAKFTVGESIPLVGGAISSMLGTLSSSLSLVKSTFGAGALVALLSLLLPVLAIVVLNASGVFATHELGNTLAMVAVLGAGIVNLWVLAFPYTKWRFAVCAAMTGATVLAIPLSILIAGDMFEFGHAAGHVGLAILVSVLAIAAAAAAHAVKFFVLKKLVKKNG